MSYMGHTVRKQREQHATLIDGHGVRWLMVVYPRISSPDKYRRVLPSCFEAVYVVRGYKYR